MSARSGRALRAAGGLAMTVAALSLGASVSAAGDALSRETVAVLKQFCFDCHGSGVAEGQIDVEQMLARQAFNTHFKAWEKVASMIEAGKMPPKDAAQPSHQERKALASQIRAAIEQVARQYSGDPGDVPLRRLTSAEYAYTIRDLTGLDLDLGSEFVSDAAGGEGFTNVGTVQFFDDAGLERYLEAAKKVASHAVIGAGPLQFFSDPGQTGLELSAIDRIRRLYREHGFRTAAGEGGVPFGLEVYPKAFFVAWQYQHRSALAKGGDSLETFATGEGVPPRFSEHVWSVVNLPAPSFPTSEIVARFRSLPAPSSSPASAVELAAAREQCNLLYRFMNDWQSRLARTVGDEEEAAILSEHAIQVRTSHTLVARFAWMDGPPKVARLQFSVASANPGREVQPVVIWQNPRLRFRRLSRRREVAQPLASVLPAEVIEPLALGLHGRGGDVGRQDFVTLGEQNRVIEFAVPEGVRGLEVVVDVKLDLDHGEDCVVRSSVSEGTEAEKIKSVSALLANPDGAPYENWRAGVVDFARYLPQVSHREPAPSDRDPIPAPFDNTYNMPERNYFHTHVKYFRDDDFLTNLLLDDAAKRQLDDAWADLLGSFEYYDIWLRFVAEKYQVDLAGRDAAQLEEEWVRTLPEEPQRHVRWVRDGFEAANQRMRAGQARHVADAFALASRAWRRPLSKNEQQSLTAFYEQLRQRDQLSHVVAMRALMARIFMAPAFLFRAERAEPQAGVGTLSPGELANRLSYFVWSSAPDQELSQAAAAGKLADEGELARQTRRMLRDPKARRLATEFFGQWLGFYQFDRFRGVDPDRFPEFDERLKQALHEEAVSFFEHLVREKRPLQEILFADYSFLNASLARHYGLNADGLGEAHEKVQSSSSTIQRGGLLSLGSIMAATSAPLRTSPVKRGDWVLRRVLGTPVPPPPANAGSIEADDAPADGKSVRQRLEAHRQDAACINCHSKIDPLGFALEHYDTLGRWRETYRDGQAIDDVLTLEDGRSIAGPAGLKAYLHDHQHQFYRTLSTKLLAYALGRSELASDQDLMTNLLANAKSGEGTLADLVVTIVASPQFRSRRAGGETDAE